MTGHVKVYGASDDLIEIRGDIVEEFGGYDTDERPGYLAFSDGTILRIQYGINDEGIWRIAPLHRLAATAHAHAVCKSEDDDSYSDVLTISAPEPIRCVVYGRVVAVPDGATVPKGYTRISGNGGHIVLEGDCPARFDVDTYETEIHVYLGLADGTVVECRCGESTLGIWRFTILHAPATTVVVQTPCPLGGTETTDVIELRPAVPICGAVCGDCIGVRGH